MKKLIILCFALPVLYAQELEVEGNLKVTGEIDAQGNPITNVGNPIQDDDAVNLSTVRDMSGMKPERIYRLINIDESNTYTVPSSKIWIVYASTLYSGSVTAYLNGATINLTRNASGGGYNAQNVTLFAGDTISFSGVANESYVVIFEYPISGSGTDQGMDYVEP